MCITDAWVYNPLHLTPSCWPFRRTVRTGALVPITPKYLTPHHNSSNTNGTESFALIAVSRSNKTPNWLGSSATLPMCVNFFLLCGQQNLFTPWHWIPMGRMGKGRSELLTSQIRFFFSEPCPPSYLWKCKTVKWDFFFLLLIGQLVKGGYNKRNAPLSPRSALWGCNRGVIHFIWTDRNLKCYK